MARDIDFWEPDFFEGRFKKLILRSQFDEHKNIKDVRAAKALLIKTEEKFKDDINPYHASGQTFHAFSKDGISYGRVLESPDYVMDYYHPLEKARYPYYFAKREQMKEEYVRIWRKKMMKPEVPETGHPH